MLDMIQSRFKTWLAYIILGIIIVSFAVTGMNYYFSASGKAPVVATIDGQKIFVPEFERALQDQQERIRNMLGPKADPNLLDSNELREALLERMISDRLMTQEAVHLGYVASDRELGMLISSEPAFQENGKFSQSKFETLLRQQKLRPDAFMNSLRKDLLSAYLKARVAGTAMVTKTNVQMLSRLLDQQREIGIAAIKPEQYLGQVKVDQADIRAYYDSHLNQFKVPEQVKVEYVVLSPAVLMSGISVTDQEIKDYYKLHAAQFNTGEERQASHILIRVPGDASEAEKKKAEETAQQVFAKAKANPAKFAELAKQYSQDPGTASKGGDIGLVKRGALSFKSVEDEIFSLKAGEVGGPVASPAGLHIVKVDSIKPGVQQSLDQVREQLVQELKKQKALNQFNESADNFGNMVYEQSGSLKPVADALKLTIQQSGWLEKGVMSPDDKLLTNDKMQQAIFSPEAIQQKRNTEAIEVSPNVLVSAHVIDHKDGSVQPLDAVSALIESKLKGDKASELAAKQAQEWVKELQSGKPVPQLDWGTEKTVSRQNQQGLSGAAIETVFRMDPKNLPGYGAVLRPDGGMDILRLTKVIDAPSDAGKLTMYQTGLEQVLAQENLMAYMNSLRNAAEVKIKRENLEKKER